jgi:hypothetical protein
VTISARPRHAWVDVYDIEDTVTLHVPSEVTERITPPHRRPNAVPPPFEERRSFGYVGSTGEIPLGIHADRTPVVDELQMRFNRYYSATLPKGRHRQSGQPGWFARLLRWIGGRR